MKITVEQLPALLRLNTLLLFSETTAAELMPVLAECGLRIRVRITATAPAKGIAA